MRINISDARLTPGERRFLRDIAGKLTDPAPRQQLPKGLKRSIEEAFGDDCGGWRDRWQVGK